MSRLNRLAIHTVLILLALPAMLPLVWMISTSLKADTSVYSGGGGFSLTNLIPHPAVWNNYPKALQTVPFDVYLKNTVTLCALTVLGAVMASAWVAYGFARIEFRGRGFLFALMIATIAMPDQVTRIPVFELFRSMGWYGTYLPLVVPAFAGAPFYIFLLTQFFKTLPDDLAESARLDGAGEFRIFRQIVLPLAIPALTTVALFQFLSTWNDFTGPLIYINDPGKYTLAYGLQQFMSAYDGQWAQLMAASIIFTIPIVVLFFFAQRTFIQGIATTGGKN
jgi:multiple sugar transport system permease protein